MKTHTNRATIAAIATAQGPGGIGVVRLSGARTQEIAQNILGKSPRPRYAYYTKLFDSEGVLIDEGVLIFFKGPYSFTGEDVLEFQGHGGTFVLQSVLEYFLRQGAMLAGPGEFTQRAYLNQKIDLAQAEAVADLITAGSKTAARAAMQSLSGRFSQQVTALHDRLVDLRVWVEALIDFPEEDLEGLQFSPIAQALQTLSSELQCFLAFTQQGELVTSGATAIIVGKPNAGKSSLFNALAAEDKAIVTDIAGTTRDLIEVRIDLAGVPLKLIDTAGLREDSSDPIEQIGIERARQALSRADLVLWVKDIEDEALSDLKHTLGAQQKQIMVYNKVDLQDNQFLNKNEDAIYVSAKTMQGMDALREAMKKTLGHHAGIDGLVSARHRHVQAVKQALLAVEQGLNCIQINAIELLAQSLRDAHEALGDILGKMTADDMLGKIFSTFCIGK